MWMCESLFNIRFTYNETGHLESWDWVVSGPTPGAYRAGSGEIRLPYLLCLGSQIPKSLSVRPRASDPKMSQMSHAMHQPDRTCKPLSGFECSLLKSLFLFQSQITVFYYGSQSKDRSLLNRPPRAYTRTSMHVRTHTHACVHLRNYLNVKARPYPGNQ